MKTKEHRVHGQVYQFIGANADLWEIAVANEHRHIFAEKSYETLANALEGPTDNERVTASKELIKNLWSSHPELGPYPFLDCLSKFEFQRQFHHGYRDHVCHQLKVYLLGLGVLSCSPRLRDEVDMLVGEDCRDRIWLVTAVFHDIGYVVEHDHSQPGDHPWQKVKVAYRESMQQPLKSFFKQHQVSENAERRIQKVYGISTPTLDAMGDLEQDALFQAFGDEGVRAKLAPTATQMLKTPVQRYFEYAQKTASKLRPPFKDHGIASALLLAKTWLDFDEYLARFVAPPSPSHAQQLAHEAAIALAEVRPDIQGMIDKRNRLKKQVMRSAGAMSLHNITPGLWDMQDAEAQGLALDTFKIAIGQHGADNANPLSFLLAFVDTLQDWDRPTFSEIPDEGALHSPDISVTPDKQAEKVMVHVRADAEEFRDPSTSRHAKYYRVVTCMKEFLDESDVSSLIGWKEPEQPTIDSPASSSIMGDAAMHAAPWEINFNDVIKKKQPSDPWRWTVVLSKDEASRHGELIRSLKRDDIDSRIRFIDSGFAYWGIGPTIQWRLTCQDPFYTVMKKGIDTFPNRWRRLAGSLERQRRPPCVYVSYGVGTGEKDHVVLETLSRMHETPAYVPIDMSLDMLINGAQTATRGIIDPGRVIPLQIDFSQPAELQMLTEILENVLGDRPVLFSLLGNTLANFEDDISVLKLLTEVMRESDGLLLELATTESVSDTIAKKAAYEYSSISSFDNFVRSALSQHTDLPYNKIVYDSTPSHDGAALQIDMYYVSKERCEGRLIDGSTIELDPDERIRLYRSRKYTQRGIRQILGQAGLTEKLAHLEVNKGSSFGFYLGMCVKSPV
jgi:L-histidine N-alpha-methyltransferase